MRPSLPCRRPRFFSSILLHVPIHVFCYIIPSQHHSHSIPTAGLPVLGGARLLCYLSAEAWHDDGALSDPARGWGAERLAAEVGVYRAQIQARAVENNVFVVGSNWGWDPVSEAGSHGCSKIVGPTGLLLPAAGTIGDTREGPVNGAAILTADINLTAATAFYAEKSLLSSYALAPMWRDAKLRYLTDK